MNTRLRYPKGYQFLDANGHPLALGNLYYYIAGTTTSQDTYSDSAGTVPNTNPVVLDGSGRLDVDVYLGSASDYKEVLTTSSTTVSPWPDDNIVRATSIAIFTGDSGSGGVSGLVPAPAAGDALANKFLKADGTWAVTPAGSGSDATNLSAAETATTVTIASSSGSGATIPAATPSLAGVLDSARAAKIDGLAKVAASGSYTDLSNTPTIPAAQVNSDWNASRGISQILNKPSAMTPSAHASTHAAGGSDPLSISASQVSGLAAVATSGAYNSLSGVPTAMTPTAHAATHLSSGSDPLPVATASVAGLVKIGSNISVAADGTIAATSPGFANPMTASGDLIIGGASGAASRLAIGSTGQVLTVSGGVPAWATASGGAGTPGGSSGQLQFNSSGAFGGAAWSAVSGSGKLLSITGRTAADVPLTLNLYQASDQISLVGGSASDGTQWQLGGRPKALTGTSIGGVPFFRPATANMPGVFDIFPNGTPTTPMLSWIDVCDRDIISSTTWRSAKISIDPGSVYFGADAGGTGVTIPNLLLGGATISLQSQSPWANIGGSVATYLYLTSNGAYFGGTGGAAWIANSQMRVISSYLIGWTATSGSADTLDVSLGRSASGEIGVTNYATSIPGGLYCGYTRNYGYAYASLPTPAIGMLVRINDSTVNTVGATVAGGGSYKVLAARTASKWIVLADLTT